MPSIQAHALAASEGAGFVDILVTLDQAASSEIRASFETLSASANDASSQADFQRASGTLVFSPGERSKTVRVILVDNTGAEATESFWFQLGNAVNASIAQTLTPVLLFDNDGTAGTPGISVADVVVDERTKTANFFVSLNRPSTSTVGVSYATANDSASAGSDFQAATGLLSFAPGEMVKTVSVALTDDTLAEPDEVFQLVLSSASNATIVNDTGRARIGASDAATMSAPYVTAKPAAADETQALIGFVVQLSAPSNNEVKIRYDTLNGTASHSASMPDVQRVTGTLVFAPGETTRFVAVPVVNDTVAEKSEAFWLELSSPVNAVVAQRLTSGLLFDNDTTAGLPIVQVSGDPTFDERAGTVSHFVWLDRPSAAAITLQWVGITGTAGSGDARLSSGTISFAPGETVKTVSTALLDDTLAEPVESFTLGLVVAAGSSARLASVETEALISANDGPPAATPYLRAVPSATDEAQPLTGFTVLLSAPSNNEVRVNFDTVNATADYTTSQPEFLHSSGTLAFAPGETSKFVPVVVVDDGVAEGTSSYWLELSSAVNATVEQRLTPGLVIDNDGIGTGDGEPLASISDAVVDELAGLATFFISLDRPATGFGWVNYKTADGTAVAGSDYRAVTGSASFMPGESVATVTVPIHDDGLAETDERFQLVLTPAVGSQVLDAIGTALIGRGDGTAVSRPVISAGPITVGEGDALAMFVLQLSAPSSSEVRITVDIGNGTASYLSSKPDLLRVNTTLVFAPGQTIKTVVVPLIDDSSNEGAEAFNLLLLNPVNATVAQASVAATLLDNDGGGALLRHGISNDIYTLATGTERIAESPGGGIDSVKSGVSYTLPDNVENLLLSGSAGSAIGNAGDNVLRGTAAANTLDGKGGIDTAIFIATQGASTVSGTAESRTVSSTADGNDTLLSIERLQFSDTVVAYDSAPGGHVHGAYAMWNAAFNAAPSKHDLSRWTAMLDTLGGNTTDLAQTMINAYAPGVSNEALVSHLWGTLIGGAIPADQLALYTGLLTAGTTTQAGLLALAATLEVNTAEFAGIVGLPQALDPAYFPIPG